MSDPPWLSVMKTLTGTKEVPGPEANPVIVGMTDEIARIWPDMKAYCDLPSWDSDETAWCGVAAAFCVSQAGLRPPFGNTDTDRFGWAQSWADDENFVPLSSPRPGAIVVMTRSGGGHVTFYESTSGSNYMCRGGNQSNSVNLSAYPKSSVIALIWPKDAPLPPLPPGDRPELEKGDTGPEVASVQRTLGIVPVDGDFGMITDGGVRGYQAACGLEVDGEVGENTWKALDALDARKAAGTDGLKPELITAIVELAEDSAIAGYQWRDRGKAPVGYTAGVALCFALAQTGLAEGEAPAFIRMARADTNNPDKDALSWYRSKFQALGMDNSQDGIDTLRHLFTLMLGLGMRESSGRYCEGRDMSASNVQSDTAEAGLFQTSWNIRSCDPAIAPLLPLYWDDPNGFLTTFQNGVAPDANDLGNFGSGDGAKYQFLSKYAPAFHAFVTALGMRSLRQHWGPINRNEVELKPEADDMLWQVQELVAGGVEPVPPEPPVPPIEHATVALQITASGPVTVTVNGTPIGSI
jgi:uncharacterized protein (TIGR02594 family)